MKNKLLGKTLQVLETIAASTEPKSLKSIAAELDMASGTLSRIISDLCEYGLIEKFGYHHVRSSLGMIRLGQDAMTNLSLPRIIPPIMRAHEKSADAHGAFAGVHHWKLVYLYHGGIFGVQEKDAHLTAAPPPDSILRSRLAAAILGTQYDDAKLQTLLSGRSASPSELAGAAFFLENCRQVRANGYVAHREFGRGWSVNFPVRCDAQVYGVSLFGQDAENCNLERMIFETSLLASRLTSALDERSRR